MPVSSGFWLPAFGIVQLLGGFGTPAPHPKTPVVVERQVLAMGTVLLVRVGAADLQTAERATEAALRAVEQTDDLLSTWRDDTELARLNRGTPGAEVALSRDVVAWLREMGELQAATGGAFDPAVGSLIDAWGLRAAGSVPAPPALQAARRAAGWDRFRIGETGATRLDRDAWLDSGAFGKGAALRAARDTLLAAGVESAFLNFGGQILAVSRDDATAWQVPIADPRNRAHGLVMLALGNGSIATSGQSERNLEVDGRWLGHILDPRSGEPAPAWGSVTVVDPDPLRADALATALFVLGPDRGWAWAERHHVAALFVTDDGTTVTLRATATLDGLRTVGPPGGIR